MATCIICLDALKSPVALPCGHVFCHTCITYLVHAATPFTTQHVCPTCRRPYSILSVDPSLYPPHFRPHITPGIRKLYLEESTQPKKSSADAEKAEFARLRSENSILRSHCESWRKRAEAHSAATLGLVGLATMARNHAIQMRKERDDLSEKYSALKRKIEEPDFTKIFSPSSSCFNKDINPEDGFARPAKRPRNMSPSSTSISLSITTRR